VEALHAGIANADASSDNAAAKMVRTLLDQYSSCQDILLSMLQDGRSSGLQLACLNTLMDFTRAGTPYKLLCHLLVVPLMHVSHPISEYVQSMLAGFKMNCFARQCTLW
jgi:hypothetical protein